MVYSDPQAFLGCNWILIARLRFFHGKASVEYERDFPTLIIPHSALLPCIHNPVFRIFKGVRDFIDEEVENGFS